MKEIEKGFYVQVSTRKGKKYDIFHTKLNISF